MKNAITEHQPAEGKGRGVSEWNECGEKKRLWNKAKCVNRAEAEFNVFLFQFKSLIMVFVVSFLSGYGFQFSTSTNFLLLLLLFLHLFSFFRQKNIMLTMNIPRMNYMKLSLMPSFHGLFLSISYTYLRTKRTKWMWIGRKNGNKLHTHTEFTFLFIFFCYSYYFHLSTGAFCTEKWLPTTTNNKLFWMYKKKTRHYQTRLMKTSPINVATMQK